MISDRLSIQHKRFKLLFVAAAVFVLFCSVPLSLAQSSDQDLPTAVLSNEITGAIPALDLGDPRLTRHYYAFEATPGDLIVTVNSRNLNGDVDIFTAVTLRPLTKISVYANTLPPEVTKSLYFRTRQILILRVEARTPNDDTGTYRITFGGSFQPFSGGIPVAENVESSDQTSSDRGSNRLSSVGATLPRPPEEAKPEEPKPAEPVVETPKEDEVAKKPAPKPRTTRSTPRSTARNRPARTPRSKPPATEKPKTEEPKSETATTEPATTETAKPKTAKTAKPRKARTEETKAAAAEGEEKSGETTATKPAAQEEAGPHLIIERTDGTRIDRPMSSVRRVIVESGVIVVVLKNGRSERIPMSGVSRMAIEP